MGESKSSPCFVSDAELEDFSWNQQRMNHQNSVHCGGFHAVHDDCFGFVAVAGEDVFEFADDDAEAVHDDAVAAGDDVRFEISDKQGREL